MSSQDLQIVKSLLSCSLPGLLREPLVSSQVPPHSQHIMELFCSCDKRCRKHSQNYGKCVHQDITKQQQIGRSCSSAVKRGASDTARPLVAWICSKQLVTYEMCSVRAFCVKLLIPHVARAGSLVEMVTVCVVSPNDTHCRVSVKQERVNLKKNTKFVLASPPNQQLF